MADSTDTILYTAGARVVPRSKTIKRKENPVEPGVYTLEEEMLKGYWLAKSDKGDLVDMYEGDFRPYDPNRQKTAVTVYSGSPAKSSSQYRQDLEDGWGNWAWMSGSYGSGRSYESGKSYDNYKPPYDYKSYDYKSYGYGGTYTSYPSSFSKWNSAGCVVVPGLEPEDLEYIYVIKLANRYGADSGWALPKGRRDKTKVADAEGKETEVEESAEDAALREVREETGLLVKLLPGGDLGQGDGTMSVTRYFMAVQQEGSIITPQTGEVDQVQLVTWEEARKLFDKSYNKRDSVILDQAEKYLKELVTLDESDATILDESTDPSFLEQNTAVACASAADMGCARV